VDDCVTLQAVNTALSLQCYQLTDAGMVVPFHYTNSNVVGNTKQILTPVPWATATSGLPSFEPQKHYILH